MGKKTLMITVMGLLRKAAKPFTRERDAVDSEVTSSFSPITDYDREVNLERSIQIVARGHFGMLVKVAVFKRIRQGRGHVLAVIRMQSAALVPPEDPELFINQLVQAFNHQADHTLQKHIDYAIWSDLDNRPIQTRMQQEIIQRTS